MLEEFAFFCQQHVRLKKKMQHSALLKDKMWVSCILAFQMPPMDKQSVSMC